MAVFLQELIHKLEEGAGNRYLKFLLAIFAVVGAAVAYDLAAFRNLSTPEGMDAAQLGWNISEGRGFTTYYIRPFSVHLLTKKALEASADANQPGSTNATVILPAGTDAARLNSPHPDLANAPVYPLLLAGFFKIIQLSHPDLALQKSFKIYPPDLWIGILNQLLLLLLVGLVFYLARRLFDEQVAWVSVVALLGTELVWRFSLSGLPTILLMSLFLVLVAVLVRLESAMREGSLSHRALVWLAALAGVLAGVGGLTRYSFGWVIIPLVLWLSALSGPKRAPLALTALAAFLVVMTPWLLRNYSLSGAPFGTAGFAVFGNTSQFPDDQLQRSLNVDFSGLSSADFWEKLVVNGREIVQNDLARLGGSWVSAFFLVGLLVPFRNPTLNRLRWFLLGCLLLLGFVQALGRGSSAAEPSPAHADNLLVVLAPLVFIYGAGLFFTLFSQIAGQFPPLRFLILGAFCLLACAPLLLALFPPYPWPTVYPPYYPPWIQEKAWLVDEKGLIMTDMPWAVAWYGQRPSIDLTLKYKSNPAHKLKNGFYEVDSLKPVSALYLTTKTLKLLEAQALWNWVQGDADAGLLNQLRQRVAENHGRAEKEDEDSAMFRAVRDRLVQNAGEAQEAAEDWERFVMGTFLKSEVPTGFPLREAPKGLVPELFLMDSERGKRKAIQSSK